MEALPKNVRKVITAFIVQNKNDMDSKEIQEATGMTHGQLLKPLSQMVKAGYLKKARVRGREYTVYHLTDKGRLMGLLKEEEIV